MRRLDRSSRVLLACVACLVVIEELLREVLIPLGLSRHEKKVYN